MLPRYGLYRKLILRNIRNICFPKKFLLYLPKGVVYEKLRVKHSAQNSFRPCLVASMLTTRGVTRISSKAFARRQTAAALFSSASTLPRVAPTPVNRSSLPRPARSAAAPKSSKFLPFLLFFKLLLIFLQLARMPPRRKARLSAL